MLSGRYIDVPDTATAAGPHDGEASRIGDPLHRLEVGQDVPEGITRTYTLCRETMNQTTDRAGIFGDSFVDINVKVSRGCHGAERVDPPKLNGSGVGAGRIG